MQGSNNHLNHQTGWIVLLTLFILSPLFPMLAGGDPLPPTVTPPADLIASPGIDRIYLEWIEPDIGYFTSTGFAIYRSTDKIEFDLLTTVSRDVFNYEDQGVLSRKEYHYYLTTLSENGESEATSTVTSIADDQDPVIEINEPESEQVIGINEVNVVFTIDERHSGIEETVYYVDDGPRLNIDGMVSFTIEELQDGPHDITIETRDRAGNGASMTRSFTIDTEVPSIVIISPQQNEMIPGNDVAVEWSAADTVTSVDSVLISIDGGKQMDITSKNIHRTGYLASGTHEIILLARDEAGNTGSDVVYFITDSDIPQVRITSPSNNTVTGDNEVTVEWTGNDPTTDPHYQISINGGSWLDVGDHNSYTVRDLEEGASTISVRIIDSVLNTDVYSITVFVDITGPVIDLEQFDEPITSQGGIIDIEWTVSDELSSLDRMEYFLDGSGPFDIQGFKGITLTDLENGDHDLLVIAYDINGNGGEISLDLIVDTVEPEIIDHQPNGIISRIPEYIDITFSEEMDPETMEVRSQMADTSISGSGNHFSIDPGEKLEFGRSYSFHITGSDLNGLSMVGTVVNFEISDITVIEGRIVDVNGRALEGATITLDTGKVTTSGKDGIFTLEERMGNITIYVTCDGFRRAETTIRSRPDRDNWAGTFRLEEDDTEVGSRISNFLSHPGNMLLTGILICVAIIGFTLMWRYIDRERYADLDIEWEDEEII